MALLSYEDARPWARSIRDRVERRQMPPWHVDKTVGIRTFKDDPSLSDREIATITAWVDGGAPRGNPADMPPPRVFDDSDRWHIGKPDLVVSIPKEFVVKPEAADWWGIFVADSGLTEDRYIKAVEAKPSPAARRVVHHAVESLVYEDGSPGGGTLVEYAVGKNGDVFPDGSGKLMKAGAKIRFNMHYHAIGEPVVDRTSVGIVFYPKGVVPKHVITTCWRRTRTTSTFPPAPTTCAATPTSSSTSRRTWSGSCRTCTTAASSSVSRRSTRHARRAVELRQLRLQLADRLQLRRQRGAAASRPGRSCTSSAGTTIRRNKYNPDPRNWVGFGNRTTDDMSSTG
jgi:hypothetical protein